MGGNLNLSLYDGDIEFPECTEKKGLFEMGRRYGYEMELM